MMMRTKSLKAWLLPATGVLAVGVGAWAVTSYRGESGAADAMAVPDEFRRESLEALAQQDMGKLREIMRATEDRVDLSEQQREQIRDNVREVFEAQVQKRMDEYFRAPPEEREAILDRHIDEFEQRRREWERREDESPEREADRERRRQSWRERYAQMSPAERKARSEGRDPNQQAQRMAYWSALRERMQQRGIQPPDRGPGGRWGRGGGR